ncbi:MAG: HD domain-containing protein [Archangium sp.]|nr:HD domain-containing protein [Archangium sp.]
MRIRDPIHGSITVSDEEARVIDSRTFQRLRHVRQLGFGDLAFPGATHTRHAHSLGAMHVASRLFDAITSRASLSPRERDRLRAAVRLAVLCHDIGHMPLSHSSESIAPARATLSLPAWVGSPDGQATHEDFTAMLLVRSELTRIIDEAYAPLGIDSALVASLVMGVKPPGAVNFAIAGVDWTPVLRAIVSGELDADRMDYLLRDSFYTGVNYGRYDLDWILQNLSAVERDGRMVLALSKAAVFAFEDFLLSRYHMFLSVYFHHTSVSFDWMLKRYYEEAPGEFEVPSDPEAFLECDDMALHVRLRKSKNEWAQRIAHRRGFKRVAQFTERDEAYDLSELSKALDAGGVQHFTVESRGILSKYFDEGETTSLFVLDRQTNKLTDVQKYTPLFERFAGGVHLSRVYVRPDQFKAGSAVVERLLGNAKLDE